MKQIFTFFYLLSLFFYFSEHLSAQIQLSDTTLWSVNYATVFSPDNNSVSFPNDHSIRIAALDATQGEIIIPSISCGNQSQIILHFDYEIYNIILTFPVWSLDSINYFQTNSCIV